MRKIIYVLLCTVLLQGCGGGPGAAFSTDGLDTLYAPRHASGFMIYKVGGSALLSVRDPWQGARDVEMQLFISYDGEPAPEGFHGTVVSAPLNNVVCMSSSYIAMLDALGETDAITGVSGARYVTNPGIRERYDRGDVRDVGYDAHMNYELLAGLRPDLVMIYGVSGENSQMTGKLAELGIKFIYIGDYVEQSPLGKAEWLVALGEMFGRRAEAERIFGGICGRYDETRNAIAQYGEFRAQASSSGLTHRPAVMLNAPYRDTWYVPGDRSYMVRLIEDAGAAYVCAGYDSDASRPISGESAYVFALKSDFWFNPGTATTMDEVRSLNPKFADIPAVRNGRVYNCNARTTPDGGSDFWESGAVRPDVVLRDMAAIFYPGLFPEHELYYFRQMR